MHRLTPSVKYIHVPTDFHSYYNNLSKNNVTQNYRNLFIEL